MRKCKVVVGMILGGLVSSQAFSNSDLKGFVGVYAVPDAKIEIKNTGAPKIKDSGEAYGIVAEIEKNQWFGYTHYETVSIDINALPKPGVSAEEYRLGGGYRQHFAQGSVQASIEYFAQKQDFDFEMVPDWDDSGIGIHLNTEHLLGVIAGRVPVAGFADIGYIDMHKSDAQEYRLGVKAMLAKNIGVMTAYRIFKQEKDESNEKTTLKAMNIGLSYVF